MKSITFSFYNAGKKFISITFVVKKSSKYESKNCRYSELSILNSHIKTSWCPIPLHRDPCCTYSAYMHIFISGGKT